MHIIQIVYMLSSLWVFAALIYEYIFIFSVSYVILRRVTNDKLPDEIRNNAAPNAGGAYL